MKLAELLTQVDHHTLMKGSTEIEISDLVYDSRLVKEHTLFFCVVGSRLDSHTFISEAVAKGAVAVVIEREVEIFEDITVIRTENSKKLLSYLSAAFFGYPARSLTKIAITGTKGKTTTAYMIKALLEASGKETGIIGTIGVSYRDIVIPTHNTTPESYEIQKIFREMADSGIKYVVMEVSSQAYLTNRVSGITFEYGVFTNLSPDHIGEGEHKDFTEYLHCKSQLFQNCQIGIVNKDDAYTDEILKNHTCKVRTFGVNQKADFMASEITCCQKPGFIGIQLRVDGVCQTKEETDDSILCSTETTAEKPYQMKIEVGCMGRFNAWNVLAALSVASLLGVKEDTVKQVMYHMAVRGRVEPVHISDHFHLIIDYAHNAVSAESLLATMREYHPKRLIAVFGAGGNRSKLRRYDMGEIAGKYADLSILTADNPRFEKVEDIIADIEIGIQRTDGVYKKIPNRKDAIRYVIETAKEGDLIALFGKGHEDYQEIEGVRYPFDERVVIAEIVEELGKQRLV